MFRRYLGDCVTRFFMWAVTAPGASMVYCEVTGNLNFMGVFLSAMLVGMVASFWRLTLFYLYLCFWKRS